MDHVKGAHAEGALVFAGASSDALDQAEQAYLTYCNGDPRVKRLTHHEVGCCTSREQTKEAMFAAIVGANCILGSDADLPAENRWGSASASVANVSGGIMNSDVLTQTVDGAFSTWEAAFHLQ